MSEFITQIYHAMSSNLTALEAFILVAVVLVVRSIHYRIPWTPTGYTVFLIIYITLLRRAPGYRERTLLLLRLQPVLGIWVGNILNLILYIPFGWAAQCWKRSSKMVILAGVSLSVSCETIQYLTARGQADLNDMLFNTLGTTLGVWLAGRINR